MTVLSEKTVPSEKTVLSEKILEAAGKCPKGFLLAAKQFLALGKLVKITRGR